MKTTVNFTKGKMNKDLDKRLVPNGEYIDAQNISVTSLDSTQSIGGIKTVLGNTALSDLEVAPSGLGPKYKISQWICNVIGSYSDEANDRVFWFINVEDGPWINGYVNLIVSLNQKTNSVTYHVIDEGDALNFSKDNRIVSVNLVENLLFWTDDLNPPKRLNVNRAYPQNLQGQDDFLVIVRPPMDPPVVELSDVPSGSDFLREKIISFAYRYKYQDGEYSALSPFSEIAFSPKTNFDLDPNSFENRSMVNKYNQAAVYYETGPPQVVGIDICYKEADGNEIKVIQRIDKEVQNIADFSTLSVVFSDNKVFTTLPSTEWFRMYDNVPHKAKAQTVMGNRLMYGNYVEGYDMIDSNGNSVNISYATQAQSEESIYTSLSYVLSNQNYPANWYTGAPSRNGFKNQVVITIPTEYQTDIKKDTTFSLTLSLSSEFISNTSIGACTPFDISLNFTAQKDYTTFQQMITSPEFSYSFGPTAAYYESGDYFPNVLTNGNSLTDKLVNSIPAKTGGYLPFALGSTNLVLKTSFYILSTLNTEFNFMIPAIVYRTNPHVTSVYEYFSVTSVLATISSTSKPLSLHSNRDYQVGIVYMDGFKRSSTVFTSQNNTVSFSSDKSVNRNRVKVTIPVSQKPPYWATNYKFVIKSSKDKYRTVLSNSFFDDPSTAGIWVRLEGEAKNFINVGDKLIVKRDTSGPVGELVKTTVLAKEAKGPDWILNNGGINEPEGVYMQVKPEGWMAVMNPKNYLTTGILKVSSNDQDTSYATISFPLFDSGTNVDWDVPEGSRVDINIWCFRFGRNCGGSTNNCGRKDSVYAVSMIASRNYANFYDFWVGETIDVTTAVHPTTSCFDVTGQNNDAFNATILIGTNSSGNVVRPSAISGTNVYQFARKSANSGLYLNVRNGSANCTGFNPKDSRIEGYITIQKAGGNLIVFETEPEPSLPDFYYENQEVFSISGGFHQCNTVNQTALLSGVSVLNFANCFTFGNGVESYSVKDSIKSESFGLGQRGYAVSETNYAQIRRFSDITYSGVYNRESNVNKLNEFNLGLLNFKSLEASYASIQYMHPRQTDILVFQEDRISTVLVGKNIVSDTTGGGVLSSVPEVLGNQVARVEEFGISRSPESFASYGQDVYFVDTARGAVLKMTGDQLSIISDIGMRSYFRSIFEGYKRALILGGFDPLKREYVLHIADEPNVIIDAIPCGGNAVTYSNIEYQSLITVDFAKQGLGTVTIDISTTDSATYNVYYNGSQVDTDSGTSVVLTFTRSLWAVSTAIIEIIPDAKWSGTVQVSCPSGGTAITVHRIVLGSRTLAGLTAEIAVGTFSFPINRRNITFPNCTTAPCLAYYEQISLSPGSSFLPLNGTNIQMYTIESPGTSFVSINTDRFRILRSNTFFDPTTAAGVNSIVSVASAITPSTSTNYTPYNSYTGSGSIGAAGNAHLYLVWDYRRASSFNFCYHASSPSNVCCSCNIPCPTCIEVQTTGVYVDFSSACKAPVTITLYHSGLFTPGTQFYFDPFCSKLNAYPGYYSYFLGATRKWFQLDSSGKLVQNQNC